MSSNPARPFFGEDRPMSAWLFHFVLRIFKPAELVEYLPASVDEALRFRSGEGPGRCRTGEAGLEQETWRLMSAPHTRRMA
jgi:hypothetical protein